MAGIPVLIQTPKTAPQLILPADGTSLKNLWTAGASGSKITSINITNNDTINHTVSFQLNRNATGGLTMAVVTVPTLAGIDGATSGIELLTHPFFAGLPIDADGNPYFFLQNLDILQCRVQVAMNSGKTVYIVATGADF